MDTNLTTQAQRSQEKKQQIFETAMEMFRQKGYNQTTIRDICTTAGITTGTFYNFYGDKFGILLEYLRQITEEREHILEYTPEKLSDPYQTICDYFMMVVRMQDRFGRDLSREFGYRSTDLLAGGSESEIPGIHQITMFFQKAIEAGYLPETVNPWYTAEYLVSGLIGSIQYWCNLSRKETMYEVAKRLLPMIFASVADKPVVIP